MDVVLGILPGSPVHQGRCIGISPIGLLINFNEMKLANGVHRLILPGSNR